MATTKLKPIELFVPFTNITRRDEDGAMIVEGYCYVNPRVKGDRFSITRAAMEAATPGYTEFPAIREMHQPIAAGTGLEVTWDEKGCFLRSECVDEGTQKKIDKKVLRGYSIGVNALTVRGDDVESLDWVETSYVDRPKDPDAVFLYRADGFDWDAEVEAEVLDTPDAPAAAANPEAAAAPDPAAIAANTPSSPHPSGEVTPSADPDIPAEGALFPAEEPDLSVMRAALVRSGTPEEMLDQLDVAASYQALTPEQRMETPEWLAADKALEGERNFRLRQERIAAREAEIAAELARAQTTGTVPIRENLDGMPKPPPEQRPQIAPRPLPVPPVHPAPGTGYPPPATNPPAIPPGMMPKRMRGYVGALPDGCWGLFRSLEDDLAMGVFLDLGEATEALKRYAEATEERVIKHEDGKWCVYSESGKKLGEHDTEAEAKKQLQAIEIEKHKDDEGATQPKKDRAAEAEAWIQAEADETAALLARSTTTWASLDGNRSPREVPGGAILPAFPAGHDKGIWEAIRQDDAGTCHRIGRFATPEEATAALAPAVEEPPAAPETISRTSLRDDVTAALTRAATAEAELARVRSGQEEALTRLAAAEARVQTLERMPAKMAFKTVPEPTAAVRTFLQNLGRDEDVELKRLQAEYPAAKLAAEEEARVSGGRGGAATDRWMQMRSALIQLGVSPDTAAPGG